MISITYILDQIPKAYLQQFHLSNLEKMVRILPKEDALGVVYEIPIQGSLERDGFEKSLLYMTTGSCILEKEKIPYDQNYRLIFGKMATHGSFVNELSYYDGRQDEIESTTTNSLIESNKTKRIERR